MKYVILRTEHEGFHRLYPIIFPEYLTHSTVAKCMANAILEECGSVPSIESAGFYDTRGVGQWARCTHGSESLGIKPDSKKELEDAVTLSAPAASQGIVY